MDEIRKHIRALAAGGAGAATGLLVGVALLAFAGAAVAHRVDSGPDLDPGRLIEISHVPPLLTTAGEPVELRFDIYCASPTSDPESGAPCDAGGTVFLRPAAGGPFRAVPLRLDSTATEGRYVAHVPADVAASRAGFSYYAVVRNNASGATLTLPAAGAAAPQRSLPLVNAVAVDLGARSFAAGRKADARVVSVAWGGGPGEVGLEAGRGLTPIGGTAFDVSSSGDVSVLDEAHRRVLRFAPGARSPIEVPLAINGTLADMSVAPSGTIYVLESTGEGGPHGRSTPPLLRAFAADGQARGTVELAERTVSQVRVGPSGPVTLQYPSGQWMPAVSAGVGLSRAGQVAGGRPGRPLPTGSEVVVLRRGNELRVAIVEKGVQRRSWVIRSSTALAEVQLAEPVGDRLVVVVRAYDDRQDEFVVLVVDDRGLVESFSVGSSDWAETAPLTRFRLVGSSLYQLGSTPDGLFVDRYDLGVSR